jgi:hypothetical protein
LLCSSFFFSLFQGRKYSRRFVLFRGCEREAKSDSQVEIPFSTVHFLGALEMTGKVTTHQKRTKNQISESILL